MKTRLLLISLCLLSFSLSFAGQGGPDKFGYVWLDSYQSGGPTYQWKNIVSPENQVFGLADDNFKGPFPISIGTGSEFHFYWYPVDQLWIGSNGYVSFSPVNLASVFPTIPDSLDNKHNFISALLSDLTFGGANNPGKCYLKVKDDSIVISFINVPFYSQTLPNWTGSNTFQIILDKNDNSITVNYQSQSGTAMTSTDVKAGIENITGCIGLQAFYAVYPAANYTIKYYYPTNSNYHVSDGAVRYNGIPFNRGVFVPYPSTNPLTTSISNMGNLKIAPPFNATCQVKNTLGNVSLNDVAYFGDTLFVQHDTLVTFPTTFDPISPGTYLYTTRLYGVTDDAVFTNDSAIQEIIAIDTAQNMYELGYCGNTPDPVGISWVDGTGGVGMYFKPLTYPVKISEVQFYLLSNFNNVGCYVKIYDDDGPAGGPGTLLDSSFSGSPVGGAWTTFSYNNPVIINNGGFYVGWEMGGLNITMAVDKSLPISHRSYEIISGAWSEYRDGLSQDFMIRCNLTKTTPVDVAPAMIAQPQAGAVITAPTQISFWIKNRGNQAVMNFPVHYKFATLGAVTQNYPGPFLSAGDSILFTFTTPLYNSADMSGDLCVWTSLPYDAEPQNDKICVTVSTQAPVGIADQEADAGFRIYPNPFSSYCNIDLSKTGNKAVTLQVFNMSGQMLREIKTNAGGIYPLQRGNLSPGIYSLRIITAEHQLIRELVIY